MKELKDIITVWKQTQKNQQTAALATLVKVEGSAYRRPGARMLVTSDGQQVGTISGGCLENDVVRRSQIVLETGRSTLVKYDTTSEEDLIWGLGLGCQGVAYILIEQLNTQKLNALSLIEKCLSTKQAGAVATVFKTEGVKTVKEGECILLYPDYSVVSQVDNPELEAIVLPNLESILQQKKSSSQSYRLTEGIAEVFLEVIVPPIDLVIFGAGFDALPVAKFAKALGWYVTVIDPLARPQTEERFQECNRVILGSVDTANSQIDPVGCQWSQNIFQSLVEFNDRTVAVAMSHNYLYDLEFLQKLSTISLKYLGILGPKTRTNRLLQDLQAEGYTLRSPQLYSPVGLDIGADNPEEIALSIIAEIQAVTQERSGGLLRNRNVPIHSEQPQYVVNVTPP